MRQRRAAGTARRVGGRPDRLDGLVDSGRELRELGQLLARGRLVTLVGPAGVGKTRLALEAFSRWEGRWPEEAWLVELHGLDDGGHVPRVVAVVLATRERRGEPLVETLARALAGRRVLLVLDNCEHVADACAELVRSLLKRLPQLCVLATSREMLGVPGEDVFPLGPFSLPEPSAFPGSPLRLTDSAPSIPGANPYNPGVATSWHGGVCPPATGSL